MRKIGPSFARTRDSEIGSCPHLESVFMVIEMTQRSRLPRDGKWVVV